MSADEIALPIASVNAYHPNFTVYGSALLYDVSLAMPMPDRDRLPGMTPEQTWFLGLCVGLLGGIPLGMAVALSMIPRLVDAVYGLVHRDRP